MIQIAEVVPGEVTQAQWDGKFDATTKKIGDMGGPTTQTTNDLPEGTANKYDTGVPPANTDELTEGAVNKYDTGVPPASQDDLPDGVTAKQFLATEKTKLAGVEENAKDDQVGAEIRDLIVALGDTERKILITNPETGEFKVIGVHRNAAGNLEYTYEDVANSPLPSW